MSPSDTVLDLASTVAKHDLPIMLIFDVCAGTYVSAFPAKNGPLVSIACIYNISIIKIDILFLNGPK